MKKLALAFIVLAIWMAGCRPATPAAWDYVVSVEQGGDVLNIEAHLNQGWGPLWLDGDAERYVQKLQRYDGKQWIDVPRKGARFDLPPLPQRIRYRFMLREAAERDRTGELAAAYGSMLLTAPSVWLLRPEDVPEGDYRCEVRCPIGVQFATGVLPAQTPGLHPTFTSSTYSLDEAPMAVLGRFPSQRITVQGRQVTVAISPERMPASPEEINRWVASTAHHVADYMGTFPVKHCLVVVVPQGRNAISGLTRGCGGSSVLMELGQNMAWREIEDDWTLTHEFVHLVLPCVPYVHHWLEEGLATYVEPLVRVRAGQVSEERYWAELIDGLPEGMPRHGDKGLDNTRSWGRTYWGGATFWFLADLQIRQKTNNRKSIRDVLRGILAAGGNIQENWPISRILEAGDQAVGVSVLVPLYRQMGDKPFRPDLNAIWKELGVRRTATGVEFTRTAGSTVRRSMTGGE